MASISFRIRSNENKFTTIFINLSSGRNVYLKASTGFSIEPKQWSLKKNLPRPNDDSNKDLTLNLGKLKNYILSELNKDLGEEKVVIDTFWLKDKIHKCFNRAETDDKSIVSKHYQYIIESADTRKIKGKNRTGLSANRIKNLKSAKRIFDEYEKVIGRGKFHFVHLDKSFIEGFKKWLRAKKGYSISYCNDQLTILKMVALDVEEFEVQINRYVKNIEGLAEKREDKYIATLSFEELEKIKNVELSREALINARNWLLLGCEVGQRGGDLLKITRDNIRYNKGNLYLDLIQSKTNKAITVPIVASHIIDIVENKLPYKISDQKLNVYIKEVCKIAGINELIDGKKWDKKTKRKKVGKFPKYELITNHSFRRSFATNYYKKMPTPILMGITGHSKESTFLIYINQSEDKDANADLFRDFWTKMQDDKEPQMKLLKKA